MGKNVEFVLDHLQFSSGKGIEGFIKELAFVNHAVKKRMFAKFVRLIFNLGYQ